MSEMLSDDPGEFARQLMDAGLMGPPASTPWRAEVMRWDRPWRMHWGKLANARQDAGMPWKQAEEESFKEMLALRENPRPLRGKMADGSRAIRDAIERPKMVRKRRRPRDDQPAFEAFLVEADGQDPSGRAAYKGGA